MIKPGSTNIVIWVTIKAHDPIYFILWEQKNNLPEFKYALMTCEIQ